ncbi:RES domain-containing protein [Sphingopyxis sp. YR583]|uniref:RES family NAD+ phosphorylase n=1 Tax=Sphingopyxis sp. YR583 TaxID=1881047 RepID=UPI0008A78842|nr:RES family NAD+ phosphorylase [Sphingopyxis sp. YR583]SEH17158.1 RES domain-containing protein [Sphingopyxis sp. YR583]
MSSDTFCCYDCVGDAFLKAKIQAEGQLETCEQCGKKRESVSEFELGQWIEEALEAHFEPGNGDDITSIIEDIAGLRPEFAQQMADELASLAGYIASGGETFYDCDDGYVVTQNPSGVRDRQWESFTQSVRSQARFFNLHAEEWLAKIFGALAEDRTWGGQAVIETCDVGTGFYRARHVPTEAKAFEILRSPAAQLGPLPNGTGSAGRMNAAGVSVFYGAFDVETCVAEIRPPVGSVVVSARFELRRPLRLLNFDLLEMVVSKASHFDPDYAMKMERALFLRAFGRRIAEPVMPGEEAFGYLATQIVADYLAQRAQPPMDGLIYRSTQTGGKGRNVVLFNHASRVIGDPEPAPTPGPVEVDPRPATLTLVPGSMEITDIRAVSYDQPRRSVEIWEIELEERYHPD